MTPYESLKPRLCKQSRRWLVTGVGGFIGCNLLETLLKLDQRVVGLDNFATGHRRNLDQIRAAVTPAQWANFKLIEGDIRDLNTCRGAVREAEYVLHHAALGSVPRSIEDPVLTNDVNITGFLNMLVAARDSGAKRFVYAASSSTYGDHPDLPKQEDTIGRPLSPYADVFARTYGTQSIGLRYFNIFGPHQDPEGAYAAVIPKWAAAMLKGEAVCVNGDGDSSRDFAMLPMRSRRTCSPPPSTTRMH